ncbi:hypothetical protein [Actinophytocola sp.]|uniref:hypothetical protein n=1 Tax=Actinophytocola sp. TaxID=1872138 RepID=UPI002D7F02C5|nr:hypothetical protein [Actinophytocola sp.]HET9142307.1 hypothetical protein [Actinophytocola sp.]
MDRATRGIVLILRGHTAPTAGPIAAVVDTTHSLANQGEIIVTGQASILVWIRIAINYACPSTSAASPTRAPAAAEPTQPPAHQ